MRAFDKNSVRRLVVAGAAVATGLLLTACGSGAGAGSGHPGGADHQASAPASPSGTPGRANATGAFNDADVTFAQGMIPHHQQALDMARLADGRAEDAAVRRLADAIKQAQDPEIRTMRTWLASWGRPESAGHAGHGMAGMMSERDMRELAAVRGSDFDRTFAELMIAHHDGAVLMARTEQREGRDKAALKLADDVVRAQSAEIAELRRILDRL
ncbi:DUF305 domain-containing protein [Streptomyces sp. NPDC047434]|uniref:DUF305 domain-containing protein n=1 Tax=Streptomyces sp. NPDC047434 TaxID=3155143 RepID=UPI0033EAD91B